MLLRIKWKGMPPTDVWLRNVMQYLKHSFHVTTVILVIAANFDEMCVHAYVLQKTCS